MRNIGGWEEKTTAKNFDRQFPRSLSNTLINTYQSGFNTNFA
jgi:hypothetical protein